MKGQPTEIWKIYNKANSTLEIPVYQRNYDWGTSQCSRLFDDLEDLARSDREKQPKHFFGAVVGKNEDSWTWIVIDGQQRLTTISLLILALAKSTEAGDIEPGKDPGLAQKLVDDFLLVDSDPRRLKFKLKPVKNDAAAYKSLFGPEDDFIDSSNVTANYRFFRERLKKTTLTAYEIWDAVSRLEVMHLDLESHDDPQRIFESLNSTGLNLSESDKIRNLVLMNQKLDDQEELYDKRWNPIEQNVDYRTDWFIRWYLTAKTNKTPKSADIFEAFKRFSNRVQMTMAEILDDMFEFSKNSRAITQANTGFPAVDRQLRRANLILIDATHPFLMPVIGDARRGVITGQDLSEIIRILENYTFRRLACQVPANSIATIFATAYSEIRRLQTSGQSYADLLTWILRRRDGGSARYPADAEFRESFETRDFYHVRPDHRQYLFDVLENGDSKDNRDIADKISSGDLTIEHIMPQTLTTAWEQELGPDAVEIHDAWENRIGNLTVTGYNSAYSNSPFSKKKEMPDGFVSSPYRLNEDVKTAERWDEETMRERSRRLLAIAVDYWSFIETDYRPPEVVRPTEPMGTDTSFTGRDITGYEFGDASETVTTWAEMVPKVLSLLLQQDRHGVLANVPEEQLLTDRPQDHAGSRGLRVVDPSLGVWVNNSTWHKVAFLRRLFDRMWIDPEDLIFTLRPIKDADVAPAAEATDPEDEPTGLYASLTKFRDAVDEAAALKLEFADTAELRAEFAKDFEAFRQENWMGNLDGKPLSTFLSSTQPDDMSAEQVLAVISGHFVTESMMDPAAVHRSITDGSMASYLTRLDVVG